MSVGSLHCRSRDTLMENLRRCLLIISAFHLAYGGSGDVVVMTVYEDDITFHDHWESKLHCALSLPSVMEETCSKIWWSHEIDKARHLEENPEEHLDTYRVKTEMIKYTSHLEILTFSDKVKGPYKCQAKCGSHVYMLSCEIFDHPHTNRSTLCSEKKFHNHVTPTPHATIKKLSTSLVLGISTMGIVLVAMVLTAVLRWVNKRREARKHYQQVLQELHQSCDPGVTQVPSSTSPRTNSPEGFMQNLSLPFLFSSHRQMPTEVVYQQLPDGSQVVFIPSSKLPTYEDSMTQRLSNARPKSERCPTRLESGGLQEAASSASLQSDVSLPPSYRSILGDSNNNITDVDMSDDSDSGHNRADSGDDSIRLPDTCVSQAASTSRRPRGLLVGRPPPAYHD